MTRGYRGLQGVTGGYKGLQGVPGGYRGKRKLEMDLPKKKFLLLRMLEKDDDLFNYPRVVGKYAVFVATLFLPIRRETGRKSTQ